MFEINIEFIIYILVYLGIFNREFINTIYNTRVFDNFDKYY
jgi:hypothetical protein